MVPVDGRPACDGLIRAACRMAEARGAPWIGVHLDGPRPLLSSRVEERRLADNLRLAEELGADLIRLHFSSRSVARELLALAKTHQVTHLVVGRGEPNWRARLSGSLLEDLAQGDFELVIHVVPTKSSAAPSPLAPEPPEALDLSNLGIAIGFVALATGVGFLVFHYLGLADVIMLYMLCITAAATQFGRWPTLIASVLSILALDFFFIEPRYTFVLTDIQHIGTFTMMIGVGWVILGLAERIRAQTRLAQNQERHTRTLYRLGKELAEGGSVAAIQQRVVLFLRQELDLPVALLLCDAQGRLPVPVGTGLRLEAEELEIARTVMERGVPVGHGTELFTQSPCLMLPMPGTERPLGVLGLWFTTGGAMPASRLDLLVPLASQIALALERASLAEDRTEARIQAKHEQLRSNLLSSISHDLRTPLGTITGATTTLLNPGPQSAPGDPKVLLGTILQESRRLLRMVNNLLDITKLESGLVQAKKEWAAIEEVVGSALSHLEEQLGSRPVSVELPEIWVAMDPVLMEQALINLLDNAIKFSPPGSAIEVRGWVEGEQFRLSVADEGPGLPPGEEELIFEKLFRGTGRPVTPGAGLGLAICKGIAQAHGGSITGRTRPQGGAQIIIALPMTGVSPELNPDFNS
jgi:two-component system sensor histidine kinase KdpD